MKKTKTIFEIEILDTEKVTELLIEFDIESKRTYF